LSPRRINQISAALFVAGFGSALAIYIRARPAVFNPLLGDPLMSKSHLHELRVMGGKANVAYAEFQAWLVGLWAGENLAATIAVLTVVMVLVFRFVAAHPELFASEPVEVAYPKVSPPSVKASSPPDE